MSSFNSRWLDYAPAKEKPTQTLENAADKTDKSLKPVVIEAVSRSAPTPTPNILPRSLWQLERLLSAVGSNVLAVDLPGVPDTGHFTLA